MLPCFCSWNHKGEMLPFKDFKSMGNEKRVLYVRILLQIRCQLYFNDMNHI